MSELDNLRIFRARFLFENNVPDHTDDVFDELNKIYKNINLNTSENEYEINIEDLKYGDEIPKLLSFPLVIAQYRIKFNSIPIE